MEKSIQTKAHILETAIRVFGNVGFDVGLRVIAEAAKVSPGLILHYFNSKEELAQEAINEALSAITAPSSPQSSESRLDLLDFSNYVENFGPELSMLRRVLLTDTSVSSSIFRDAFQEALNSRIEGSSGEASAGEHDVAAESALLAAHALGSIVFLPSILEILSNYPHEESPSNRLYNASTFIYSSNEK